MKKVVYSILGGALLLALPLFLTSCEDILGEWSKPAPAVVTPTPEPEPEPEPPVKVTSITLNKSTVTLAAIGASETLTVTAIAPDDASDKTVTWSSDKSSVATVDANGQVTAKTGGTAIITATANDGSGIEAKCTVKVVPPALLTGQFLVSTTKKVQFSRGNLQATFDGSAWSWDFALNQWDFIGNSTTTATGNGNTTISGDGTLSAAGTVDLFGWSTDAASSSFGINNSADNGKYTGSFQDWGTKIGAGWFTLSMTEWGYLFNNHTKGEATVNGIFGYVIRPDGVTTSVASSYDATAWATEEADGSLFLPAAGVRNVSTGDIDGVGSAGWYWSSTSYDGTSAYNARFYSGYLTTSDVTVRRFGQSVRLVKEVPAP